MTEDTATVPGSGQREDDTVLAAENEGMDEAAGHPHAQAQVPNPLAAQVKALEKERDELKENMLRALAETDNVRKRANRQIEDARNYALEKFARDLLTVADHLARALASIPPGERALLHEAARTAFDGVELTEKELLDVMVRHSVTAIEASPGTPFDPTLHQAVTQIPSAQPAGTIAELFQSGWRIGDRTLRAAMVAVSAGNA